jgi:hypothetical protein
MHAAGPVDDGPAAAAPSIVLEAETPSGVFKEMPPPDVPVADAGAATPSGRRSPREEDSMLAQAL